MTGFMLDPAFWTAIGLFLFIVILVIARVPNTLTRGLDARASGIKSELDSALQLRGEAEVMLSDARNKVEAAAREAEDILVQARAEADRAAREGRAELARVIERRRLQAREKIDRAQADAIAELRAYTAGISVGAARRFIAEKMDAARSAKLVDSAIAELPEKLRARR